MFHTTSFEYNIHIMILFICWWIDHHSIHIQITSHHLFHILEIYFPSPLSSMTYLLQFISFVQSSLNWIANSIFCSLNYIENHESMDLWFYHHLIYNTIDIIDFMYYFPFSSFILFHDLVYIIHSSLCRIYLTTLWIRIIHARANIIWPST